MTAPHPGLPEASPDVAGELALEQDHVDRVYAELEKASRRAADVEADGMARGRTSRTGDVRDEEMTGLFERDALVYAAARRRSMIDKQYEGLVFGRLDLGDEHSTADQREVALHRPARRARRRLRAARRRLARAGRVRLLPRHPGRPDGRAAPPRAALQGRHRRRRRGRPDGARGARRHRRARRRRADRGPDPQPAAGRCATSSPPSSATRTRPSGPPRAASPRSPAAPAPARPWSRCTARPTCSTPSGGGSRTAASSSSARRPPTPPTSSACCPAWARSRCRCARSATSSRA